MAQIDGGLRGIFRTNLTKAGFQFSSIETGGTQRGIPDSEYCRNGVSGWIEFKKSYGNQVRLSVEQVGWILFRHRVGGRVFIAVRHKKSVSKRVLACDDLYVFHGSLAEELKENGLKKVMPSLILTGGPRKWDWKQMVDLLIN